MKIAQIAPLYESVPPTYYGGTERVVHYLTEELVRMGHEVTLYASGDSATSATLIPQCPRALRLDNRTVDPVAHHVLLAERVYRDAGKYDIVHSHIDYFPFSHMRRSETPLLSTLHGRLDLPDLIPLYLEFMEMPLISISDAQRLPLGWANWQRTVHHGLPEGLLSFRDAPGNYLAFLGRIHPEKRVDDAVAIARRSGIPLKIAAKIDRSDQDYFNTHIKHLLDDPLVEYVGEISETEKSEFLGNALALLFPIDWPEPFGLVMIEAMACGTPVIARRRGSVPEVMEDGITGFIIEDVEDGVRAAGKAVYLNRKRVREAFERKFTARRMARDYVEAYQQLIEKGNRHEQIINIKKTYERSYTG